MLRVEGTLDRQGEGLFDKMNGIGAHEVIIESPRHDGHAGDVGDAAVEQVLWACRERVQDLKQDRRFRYIIIFKNHGAAAGASLEHSLLAADRAADRAARGARRGGRRARALRGEGAVRLLRHPAAGDRRRRGG